MRRAWPNAAAFAVAALTLAACETAVTVTNEQVSPAWYPGYLNYTASRGGMLVEVIGTPFENVPQDQLEAVVAEVMGSSHFGPQMPFFTEPPEGFNSPMRLRVLMNPAAATSGKLLCENPDQPQQKRAGRTSALAAFCLLEDRLSTARGVVAQANGPQDPRFKALMRQLSVLLFPGTNAKPGGSGDSFRRAG